MRSRVITVALLLALTGVPAHGNQYSFAPHLWVLQSPLEIRVPPPPAQGSAGLRAELREVRSVAAHRSGDQIQRAAFWSGSPSFRPWFDIATRLLTARPKDPPKVARDYAYLAVAINDAAVAAQAWSRVYDRSAPRVPRLLPATTPAYPSIDAAIAGAASRTLSALIPEYPATVLDALGQQAADSRVWAGTNVRSDVEAGLALGRAVATRVIQRAESDGYGKRWNGARPQGKARWEQHPGTSGAPVQPLAGTWRTWVLGAGDRFRPPPPPAYGSPQFLAEAHEVIDMRAHLTPAQVASARYWAGRERKLSPADMWTEFALARVAQLDTLDAAGAMAMVDVALADAGIATWDAKYAYWSPRPVNVIRDLGLAPDWTPLLATPLFPSYVSGHAAFSAAAAEVLGALFPEDDGRYWRMATDAALSRLYSGIHFRSDCDAGLRLGRQVGRLVIAHA